MIERVADVEPSGTILTAEAGGAVVLAEGEATGHRHATYDQVTMFRDDALARENPGGVVSGSSQGLAAGSATVRAR